MLDTKSYHPGTSWNSNYPFISQWDTVETLKASGIGNLSYRTGKLAPTLCRSNVVSPQSWIVEYRIQKFDQKGFFWNSKYPINSQWDAVETLKAFGTCQLSERVRNLAPTVCQSSVVAPKSLVMGCPTQNLIILAPLEILPTLLSLNGRQ